VYRGTTRGSAVAAYHADARVMARMGFVPTSEVWSTEVQHVLVVGFVHAPEQTPAVLEALDQAEVDPVFEPRVSPPMQRGMRNPMPHLPIEVKLILGALGGIVVGLGICLVLALVTGERPDVVSLGGFGVLGLLTGLMIAGMIGDGG
jgi:hypothetical protein